MKKDYSVEYSVIAGWRKFQKRVTGLLITCTALLAFAAPAVMAQTTVFYDDFNRTAVSPGGTPEMTYTTTSTGAANPGAAAAKASAR